MAGRGAGPESSGFVTVAEDLGRHRRHYPAITERYSFQNFFRSRLQTAVLTKTTFAACTAAGLADR